MSCEECRRAARKADRVFAGKATGTLFPSSCDCSGFDGHKVSS